MTLVVDASVAVEYLLRTPVGQAVATTLEGSALIAPALLDAEVLAVLRREVARRALSVARARAALEDLATWDVERLDHVPLLPLAWSFRHNVSAHDALYLAAARLAGAALITADGPLARAPGLGVVIHDARR